MLGLRQFASWCHRRDIGLFRARRADIECLARDLEARGRARPAVSRRLATIAGSCRYAAGEDLPDHSPAARVRRPRLDCEPHAAGLDRNEAGALLVAAGLGSPPGHALISLLALNGLRVSEAAGAGIEALSLQRGHRTRHLYSRRLHRRSCPLSGTRLARASGSQAGQRQTRQHQMSPPDAREGSGCVPRRHRRPLSVRSGPAG